ncbi:tudor and KH domain-containing protein homolog isoform X2 [Pectinophora gossypiella]|uniref:tudor and KH domain-containing protein homolog isoform X2 n=1 Tax=Pectinophora gossypiella TaxID=13191 RepID=UPI00214E333E|nr:tudor and KH domain-containing protein homolog isoform X2 [Pectinophora gossypiella]
MSSKLVLPVALGLSLVTVTAFVVYYVFKKDEEDGDKTVKSSRVNVIEVNIPKSIVPALIGRSGSNIKDIEKKSGAMIHFRKFSDKDYDVCIIRGRSNATQLAETLVHEFLQNQPLIQEDTMTVPGWACGRIIGAGGESINDISHRSGARVKIDNSGTRDSTTRTVALRGTADQITQAKKLIESCVAQEKCRREIEQSKRSPRHAQAQSPPSPASEHSDDTEGSTASIEVYVSAVSSPSRFWVQLVGPQVTQLDDLVSHMTDYYGRAENRENHTLKQVSVGQVVAAVFRHDGRWYRARVHDIRPNEFDATQQVADVFFLDYGDSEYVATHELCELRADLLRLRFQAMECFLAGVKPVGTEEDTVGVTAAGARWERWHPQAVERFEELAQVARWKPLVSRTCTYRRASADGDKDKEIPGIKLFDVTEEGELDIGATLIEEGWAVAADTSPRPSPPPPGTPFGDLGNSRVLGMLMGDGSARASSVPKDHRDEPGEHDKRFPSVADKENDKMTTSKSLASGLEKSEEEKSKPKSVSNFDLSYPGGATGASHPHVNGSHDLLAAERKLHDSTETLTPPHAYSEELKANMNRIDSHHGNLEALGRSQQDLHKLHK